MSQHTRKAKLTAVLCLVVLLTIMCGALLVLFKIETITFSSDLFINGKAKSTTYKYYKNVKSKYICQLIDGDWNKHQVSWSGLEACYIKGYAEEGYTKVN